MSPPEKFLKFDIAASEFIGYRRHIMLPTRLMTIMRKYFQLPKNRVKMLQKSCKKIAEDRR